MPNKTAFVTGGTGFIGLNLVEHLTQSGWDVIALHRPNSRLTELRKYPVRLVEGAIEDGASLDRAVPENVDAVFHVAGDVSLWSGHRQRQWRTNVEGTRNMVAAALAKRAKKFVHTSTTSVYGMQPRTLRRNRAKARQGRPQLSEVENRRRGGGRARNCGRVGRRDVEPCQRHRPLRLEHLVAVHTARGQPEVVSHSARSRLLRRCQRSGAGACCRRRQGTDRRELSSGRDRGLLCRDRANGGQTARPVDQYDSRPAGRVARSPAALWNASRRSPAGSR